MTDQSNDAAVSALSRLTFVGGGHLAAAMVRGFYSRNTSQHKYQIAITARRSERAQELRAQFPEALITLDNLDPMIWRPAAKTEQNSHTVFICTRPADIKDVLLQLAPMLEMIPVKERPTVLTTTAGLLVEQPKSWLPEGTAIVKCMPNTPTAYGQGAAAVYPSQEAINRVDAVVSLLRHISPTVSILQEEGHLNIAAAIAG